MTHTHKFKKERFISQRYNDSSKTWTFQVQVRVPDHDPILKSFSEKKYGSARRAYDEAIIYRDKIVSDMRNGLIAKSNTVTVEDVFYETFKVLPVREESKRRHLVLFNKYIPVKNMLIKDVKRYTVMDSLNNIVGVKSSDVIRRVLSVWRRITKTAVIREYVAVDVCAGVIPPKSNVIKNKKRKVTTTRDALDAVEEGVRMRLDGQEADSICMALEVMWYTGLRPAECFALSVNDIHNGFISVTKELGSDITDDSREKDDSKVGVLRPCKTDASVREVPIARGLAELLADYSVDGDVLFPDSDGNYLSIPWVCSTLRRIDKTFSMYQLRHTVSTRLVTNGVDQRTIIEILGHENFDMSVYYARSNEDLKQDAVELLH